MSYVYCLKVMMCKTRVLKLLIYIIDDQLHFLCISLLGRKCFLNKNYKINKSLDFNTVLCVSAYRDMEGTH